MTLLIEPARLTLQSRALEAGCGPGHVTNMMADTGAKGHGRSSAWPQAWSRWQASSPRNIQFKEANVEHLPFDAETFDVVLINFAIDHFARPTRAVQ